MACVGTLLENLEKKVPTRTSFVPYMEPSFLNRQKRFFKIQEPFGELLKVLNLV